MHPATRRELSILLRTQHGTVGRHQLRALGVAPPAIRARVDRGEWAPAGRSVLRAVDAPTGPAQDLWVAVLTAGPAGVVSHRSAAWLWDLAPAPPRPTLIVGRGGAHGSPEAEWHRPRRLPERVVVRRGLPCTDVGRTLVDLAGEVAPAEIDGLVDQAIAGKLVSVAGLEAEVARLGRRGRRGPATLAAALERRGFVGADPPSVLESRFLRLLAAARIAPLAVEVRAGPGGRYRVDAQLAPTVFVEVDGFAYHASPEAKTQDERRRNRIRLEGRTLLVYTWRDVVDDGHRVVAELREAVGRAAAGA